MSACRATSHTSSAYTAAEASESIINLWKCPPNCGRERVGSRDYYSRQSHRTAAAKFCAAPPIAAGLFPPEQCFAAGPSIIEPAESLTGRRDRLNKPHSD